MTGRYGAGSTPPGSEAGRGSRVRRDRRRVNRSDLQRLPPGDDGNEVEAWAARARLAVRARPDGRNKGQEPSAAPTLSSKRPCWQETQLKAQLPYVRARTSSGLEPPVPGIRLVASVLKLRMAWLGEDSLILRSQPSSPWSARELAWREGVGLCSGRQAGHGRRVGHGRATLPAVPVVPGRTRLEVTSIASPSIAPHPRPAPGLRTVLRRPGSVPSPHWPSGRPLRHDGDS